MEESTWKTVTLKLKRIAGINFELIMQNLSHWWYHSWSGWNIFMDIGSLDGWLMLPFVKYFCSLVQLHYSLLSSFTRKQQLAKYNTAFVLDFWSSLQTTFAQPKDRWARRWAPFTWPSSLLLWRPVASLFPWRSVAFISPKDLFASISRGLGIASRRLVGPTDWTKCRTVYRFLSFW